jgi:hypothetical protein
MALNDGRGTRRAVVALPLDVLLLVVHLPEDLVGEAIRCLTRDALGDRPAGQAHASAVFSAPSGHCGAAVASSMPMSGSRRVG